MIGLPVETGRIRAAVDTNGGPSWFAKGGDDPRLTNSQAIAEFPMRRLNQGASRAGHSWIRPCTTLVCGRRCRRRFGGHRRADRGGVWWTQRSGFCRILHCQPITQRPRISRGVSCGLCRGMHPAKPNHHGHQGCCQRQTDESCCDTFHVVSTSPSNALTLR